MTPFLKTLKKLTEKAFGTWYEGPEPPSRLEDIVKAFMATYPKATRRQWAEFATRLAGESYKSGYQRGYEWCERDLDRKPKDSPEVKEHEEGHAWVWNGGSFEEPPGMDLPVPDALDLRNVLNEELAAYDQSLNEAERRAHSGKRYSR